ncbi:MAG: hypothetical protein H6619_03305 [Deltaproteobacteria bacterium]|nr:hypothetical protein [Deltaproteobacteria bacterium]
MLGKYSKLFLIVSIAFLSTPAFASGTKIKFQCYKPSGGKYTESKNGFKLSKASDGTLQSLGAATQVFCTDQAAKDEECVAKPHPKDTTFDIEKGIGELECTKEDCCECKKNGTAVGSYIEDEDPIISSTEADDTQIESLVDFILDLN